MKAIRMLTDEVGGNGEALAAGKTYSLDGASADHWLKRRKAELAGDDSVDEEPEGDGKPSDGLTVAQLREALEAKGVQIPDAVTKKADLAALLDSENAA